MASDSMEYPDRVDLDNCAKEPIHIIGKTQQYGVLVVCNPADLQITQVGGNIEEYFKISGKDLLDKNISFLLGKEEVARIKDFLSSPKPILPQEVNIFKQPYLLLGHLSGNNLLLEIEPRNQVEDPYYFQRQLTGMLNRLQGANSTEKLCETAAVIVKEVFDYDRVMIYRFDQDWNGEVVAECKEDNLEPWFGLHYPATDIPSQSRDLFLKHRVRMISDVHYSPVPIIPEISPLTNEPLDLSKLSLRAVSPIHIEYLKNMGVGATLSAAIVVKGKLWGLIACHHSSRKFLDFYQRETCRFLTQMFSTELSLQQTTGVVRQGRAMEKIRRKLVVKMKQQKDVISALSEGEVKFTDLIPCEGGAIFLKDRWKLCGNTPTVDQLEHLLDDFVKKQSKSLYLTAHLSTDFPAAVAYNEVASGMLSLRIAENKYLFWFRPQVVQEVSWGGNPENKAFYNEKEKRLSPRKSFEKWTEKLTGFSEPWKEVDRDMARALRENISHVLLTRQREEIEALNSKLMAANKELELFSYGLSHDLRAPVRGMQGFLNIIKEEQEDRLTPEGRELLEMSLGQTRKMTDLIDDILEYSRLNHIEGLNMEKIDTLELVQEVLDFFNIKNSYPRTQVTIQPDLPSVEGDRRMIFQLWSNLLNNALKYSEEKDSPTVEIGTKRKDGMQVYYVKDNGIGIDPNFHLSIFETFKRAVGSRYKGTGIGLAIAKKIIEKHMGEVWVESEQGKGSEFYFYIGPNKSES